MKTFRLLLLLLSMLPALAQAATQYTVPNGGSQVISEFSVCRLVANSHASGDDIMVSTNSAAEWSTGSTAFVNATHPSGITASACPGASALRLRATGPAYLSQTPGGTPTNGKIWTFSAWVKRGGMTNGTNTRYILGANNATEGLGFYTGTEQLTFVYGNTYVLRTNAAYRDVSSWMHIVFVFDSTQATASDRLKLYVNGVQVTSFALASYPALNAVSQINSHSYVEALGCSGTSCAAGQDLDGYMADVYMIDGQALAPTNFGQTNGNGEWVPNAWSGTYGTNGYHLDYSTVALTSGSNAGLGKDLSGNGNYFNTNNISVTAGAAYDASNDAPLAGGDYATFSSVDKNPSLVLSYGNLQVPTQTIGGALYPVRGTQGMSAGKWYFEYTVAGNSGFNDNVVGIMKDSDNASASVAGVANTSGMGIWANGTTVQTLNYGTYASTGVATGTSRVIQIALDVTGGKMWVGIDGTWLSSGNPAGGTSPTFSSGISGYTWMPMAYMWANGGGRVIDANFGQRPFTYTAPSGFNALSSGSQTAPAITNPSNYFKAIAYTGVRNYLSIGEPVKASGSLHLSNSLRLRSENTAYLTAGGMSNTGARQAVTISMWVKRGALEDGYLMSAPYSAGANGSDISFQGDRLEIHHKTYSTGSAGVVNGTLITKAVYRDTAAWYHIVHVYDSANSVSTDRLRLYVNGQRVWDFTSSLYPASGNTTYMGSEYTKYVGASTSGTLSNFDGYITDVYMIDGQALDASSFGEYDNNGNWVPKVYSGTYGPNGFHLNFSDTSGLTAGANTGVGKDVSGNANYFNTTGISLTAGTTYDAMTDVPTAYDATHGNFAVWNPLSVEHTNQTLSAGNLKAGYTGAGGWGSAVRATQWVSSGKWYWELNSSGITSPTGYEVGVSGSIDPLNDTPGNDPGSYAYYANGQMLYNAGTNAGTNAAWNSGAHTIGLAMDLDSNPKTLKVYVDNVLQSTAFTLAADSYAPMGGGINNNTADINFGQRPFTYTPPAGYNRLQSYNFANAGFVPDLVMIKRRTSTTSDWAWYDQIRGASLEINSSGSASEDIRNQGLLSFQNGGFTVESDSEVNADGGSYAAYMFKKGMTPGFDIVLYAGTGSNHTISHGLNSVPAMIVAKNFTSGGSWSVYHKALPSAAYYMFLNQPSAQASSGTYWNSTAPTSSVFSVGTNNATNMSGATLIAYLFSEVPGFSKFGSYVGNGDPDGPFIYTGFKPAFVLVKASSSGNSDWHVFDSARSPYNPAAADLAMNTANLENSAVTMDLLSNGFKLRHSANSNLSGVTYVYAAFAEAPFKYTKAK